AHHRIEIGHFECHVIERGAPVAAYDKRIVVSVVGVKERERNRLVDQPESQHLDEETRRNGEVRAVDIDMGDFARPFHNITAVAMVRDLAYHREIAPLRISETESVAAARGVDFMRCLAGGRCSAYATMEPVHCDAIGGVEGDTPKRG